MTTLTLEPIREILTHKYANDPEEMWLEASEGSDPHGTACPEPDIRPAKVLEMRRKIHSAEYDLESRIDMIAEKLIMCLRETAWLPLRTTPAPSARG